MSEEKGKKITIERLRAIGYILREELMPIKGLGLTVLIQKNLIRVELALSEYSKLFSGIRDQYVIKDVEKQPILFAYHYDKMHPNFNKFMVDENGNYIVVSKKDSQIIPATSRIDELDPDYKKDIQELHEGIRVEFLPFDDKRMNELMESEKLDGINLTPLVGYLFNFIDTEDIKE